MAIQYPGYYLPKVGPSPLSSLAEGFGQGYSWGEGRLNDKKGIEAAYDLMGQGGQRGAGSLASLDGLVAPQAAPMTAPVGVVQRGAPLPPIQEPQGKGARPNANDARISDAFDDDGYFTAIRSAESGGNDAARNPRSSATGRYQFTEDTWNGLARQYPALGLTADGRTDPAQQERAIRVFTRDNAKVLSQSGIPVNPGTLYAAHFLGAGGARQALSAPDETAMAAVVGPGVVDANPFLADMTVGDFKAWAASKGGGSNGGYQAPAPEASSSVSPQARGLGQLATLAAGALGAPDMPMPTREQFAALMRSDITRPIGAAILQAKMTGNRDVAKQAFEMAVQLDERQREIEQQQIENERWEREFAAGQAPDAPEPFTLGTGQVRYGPNGEEIARGPEKTASNGITYTDANGNTIQIGGSGKPLTEAQSKDTVFSTRAEGALPILDQFDELLTSRADIAKEWVPFGYGREYQDPQFQLAQQAGNEFLQAILRKDTGAAITPSEQALYGNTYLPQPGDSAEVMRQKQQSRRRALEAIKAGLPPSAIVAQELALQRSGSVAAPASKSGEPAQPVVIGGYTIEEID